MMELIQFDVGSHDARSLLHTGPSVASLLPHERVWVAST
jgi:hypothetical protein